MQMAGKRTVNSVPLPSSVSSPIRRGMRASVPFSEDDLRARLRSGHAGIAREYAKLQFPDSCQGPAKIGRLNALNVPAWYCIPAPSWIWKCLCSAWSEPVVPGASSRVSPAVAGVHGSLRTFAPMLNHWSGPLSVRGIPCSPAESGRTKLKPRVPEGVNAASAAHLLTLTTPAMSIPAAGPAAVTVTIGMGAPKTRRSPPTCILLRSSSGSQLLPVTESSAAGGVVHIAKRSEAAHASSPRSGRGIPVRPLPQACGLKAVDRPESKLDDWLLTLPGLAIGSPERIRREDQTNELCLPGDAKLRKRLLQEPADGTHLATGHAGDHGN